MSHLNRAVIFCVLAGVCPAGAAEEPPNVPRALSCDAAVERTCNSAECSALEDPPMELTIDLAEGSGDFCLYTFCGAMDAELSPQGGGVLSGHLAVAATINEETKLMRYHASIDASELTFSVMNASGDEVTTYAGKCEPYSPLGTDD